MKIAVVTGCLGFFGVNLVKRLLSETEIESCKTFLVILYQQH